MKKAISLLLAACILSLTACYSTTQPPVTPVSSETVSTLSEESSTADVAVSSESPVSVISSAPVSSKNTSSAASSVPSSKAVSSKTVTSKAATSKAETSNTAVSSSSPSSVESAAEEPETVDIILPAAYAEDMEIELTAEEKSQGFISVTKNADGSVTYKMLKSKHADFMVELNKQMEEAFQLWLANGTFVSLRGIKANENYTAVTISVDRIAYETSIENTLVATGVAVQCVIYQIFSGVTPDNVSLTMTIEDAQTHDVLDSFRFPLDFE